MSSDAERLPPPETPESFESLCLDLWQEIWRDPNAQKNGRRGQPQTGVDVFGQNQSTEGKWAGVQCKQKDNLLWTRVTVGELEAEVEKARQFKPPLSEFILATTGPADERVQERARELTDDLQRGGLFKVAVWTWREIWHEIHQRPDLLKRIGPLYWPALWTAFARTSKISDAAIKMQQHFAPANRTVDRTMRTVVELDLVGYSMIGDHLEQGLDVGSVFQLNQQIQSFIDAALTTIRIPRERAVMTTTGDGAILVFDLAADAHLFAEAVHAATSGHNRTRTSPLAKRVFRCGAATGEIVMQPKLGGGFDIAGITIARAVRLEAKTIPGGLTVDEATFNSLPADQKSRYGAKESISGKRAEEQFAAYSCQLNADGPKDAAFFNAHARTDHLDEAKSVTPLPGEFSSPVGLQQLLDKPAILGEVVSETSPPKRPEAREETDAPQPPPLQDRRRVPLQGPPQGVTSRTRALEVLPKALISATLRYWRPAGLLAVLASLAWFVRINFHPNRPNALSEAPTNSHHGMIETSVVAAAQMPAPSTRTKLHNYGLSHTNMLGMVFVPVPNTKVWFSIWETRLQDYAVFVEAGLKKPTEITGKIVGGSTEDASNVGHKRVEANKTLLAAIQSLKTFYGDVPLPNDPKYPVVNISWSNAVAFCEWITKEEQTTGKLSPREHYRLPTDLEWSAAVGLGAERGDTPKERGNGILGVYPWGTNWPPTNGAGNYADLSFKARFPHLDTIKDYDDGFGMTAPVGSFAPNAFGLFDLGGNAFEWCLDAYDQAGVARALRGASWADHAAITLISSYRYAIKPGESNALSGFRCVLVRDSAQ